MPRKVTQKNKPPPKKKTPPRPRANFEIPSEVYDHIKDLLKGEGWGNDGMGVLEHVGYLLFPSEINKRQADGTFERIKVRIRVPREHELRKARCKAREIMEEDGLDPEKDSDLFTNIETWCILSHAIRDVDEPFAPFISDPRTLEERYDKHSLMAAWAKMDAFARIVDPRPDEMSNVEIIALMAAIAREETTGPLLAYGSRAQASCIVTMARLCVISMASKSFLESLKVFRPVPSKPTP